ncbi:MAG TPA: mannosyltransferase family protein [Nitrolancea sp.]|nr:mannosyltransferase family protein [Nitrolancea sp.]
MRLTQPPEMEAVEYHHDAIVPSRRALAAFVAGYRVPLLAWVLHLALVFAVAAIGVANFYTLNAVPAIGFALPPMSGIAHYTIQPLRNWDGFWYALVALYGYGVYQASAAFWPLYPFLLRIGVEVTNWSVPVVGVLISNLAFLGALCLLYKLVTLEVSRTVAARTIWLIAFFPTAFFFSAVYTESLFLLVTVAAIYLARTGRWWWAGFFGFLAALTRNTGILILIPLGLLLLQERGWDPRRWWRQALGLTPVLLGPLLFFAELKHVWGDPLLTLHAQKGWARYRAMPWETLQTEWHKLDLTWFWYLVQHPTWDVLSNPNIRYLFAERQAYDLFIFVLFVPLTLYMLWRERPAYSLYALVSFVVPLFSPSLVHPLMSYPRFVIVLFPFFIALARLTRNRWVFSLLLALCLVQFAGLLIQFSTWFWVA